MVLRRPPALEEGEFQELAFPGTRRRETLYYGVAWGRLGLRRLRLSCGASASQGRGVGASGVGRRRAIGGAWALQRWGVGVSSAGASAVGRRRLCGGASAVQRWGGEWWRRASAPQRWGIAASALGRRRGELLLRSG